MPKPDCANGPCETVPIPYNPQQRRVEPMSYGDSYSGAATYGGSGVAFKTGSGYSSGYDQNMNMSYDSGNYDSGYSSGYKKGAVISTGYGSGYGNSGYDSNMVVTGSGYATGV